MIWTKGLAAFAAGMTLASAVATAQARVEVQLWHAMGGELGDKVSQIADTFNKSQNDVTVTAVYKGTYAETMNGAIAAFRAKQAPHIVQVFEVGTATMMAAKGAVYPIYKLMQDAGVPFDPKSYLAAVTGYYTDPEGNMLSFPFNSSTPILYYNKDAFKKAGLDPNQPPRTWPEVEAASLAVQKAGYACGFTTGWPSWVQIENFSAWHNIPIGTKANGFAGLDTELQINSPRHVKHMAQLAEWQKTKVFDYGGRQSHSAPKFYSGDCVMYMNSSAARAGVLANVKTFEVGFGMLPVWPAEKDSGTSSLPQNSIIGGATLWVLAGHKAEEYKGAAKFFAYLSRPEVQADWHQFSGYLPITAEAYELSKKQGYYDKNPGSDVSIRQMTNKPPTENSKGMRFGSFVQIRDIIEEEMEAIIAGKKSAQQGLDDAVKRGNELLRRFQVEHAS